MKKELLIRFITVLATYSGLESILYKMNASEYERISLSYILEEFEKMSEQFAVKLDAELVSLFSTKYIELKHEISECEEKKDYKLTPKYKEIISSTIMFIVEDVYTNR